jgi:hypothetical protein
MVPVTSGLGISLRGPKSFVHQPSGAPSRESSGRSPTSEAGAAHLQISVGPVHAAVLKVAESLPWWRTWRGLVGTAVVLAQLVVVIAAHSGSSCCVSHYFAWAPNDYSVDYSITAIVNGQTLGAQAVGRRYELPAFGFWEDTPQKLEHDLRRRDELYGKGDAIRLIVRYRLDGHRPATWRWSRG